MNSTVRVLRPMAALLTGLAMVMSMQAQGGSDVQVAGQGMQNMMQEPSLAGGSELCSNPNVGSGQMVAADFILTRAVVFSENYVGWLGPQFVARQEPA